MRPFIFLILSLLITTSSWAGGDQVTMMQQEAEYIAQEFVGNLKPQLLSAMQQGGPEEAIKVCSEVAPQIAKQLSSTSGWLVKRVSLKARNRSMATPDDWEQTMLEQFDQRRTNGEPAATITATTKTESKFRYMKAQGVGPLCLNCHGENLSSQVKHMLKTYYPEDRATGYRLGEIRGAISLTYSLQ